MSPNPKPGNSAETPRAEAVTELRDPPPLSLAERIELTFDTGELPALSEFPGIEIRF